MKLGALRQLAGASSHLKGEALQQWVQKKLISMGLDPNALYQELEMTSRYVDTHRDISFASAHMQLHSHTFYELLFCCRDSGAEYLVGSERYRLQKGDIIFIPPGISHRPLLPETMAEPYERYVLWLSQEFLEIYGQFCPITDKQAHVGLLRTAGTPWESLKTLFYAGVVESEQQKDGWEAAVIGNTLQLLSHLRRATAERSVHSLKAEKPMLLDQLTAFVEQNYPERITLELAAGKHFVSPSTVSHLFQQTLGVSFYRYVTQRRLIAAKSLIEKGELLEDAAVQSGFSDYSGFYRAFRREYGISPRQYRTLQESTGKSIL